jgi:hypothetical protein
VSNTRGSNAADLVEVTPPLLDADLRIDPIPEPLQAEIFVAQLAVEGVVGAILPGIGLIDERVSIAASSNQRRIAVATNSGPVSDRR